jgi:hypothetical protein
MEAPARSVPEGIFPDAHGRTVFVVLVGYREVHRCNPDLSGRT